MSSLPFDNHQQGVGVLYPDHIDALHSSWPLLHEINSNPQLLPNVDHNTTSDHQPIVSMVVSPQFDVDKGLIENNPISKRARERRRKINIKQLQKQKMAENHIADQEGLIAKKISHNAKERVRRLKLNGTYLALRSLLPNSRRSKKRWSAPFLIDKVLEYIPELENEIEKLTLKKNTIIENKQLFNQSPDLELQSCTVSVNEVRKGQVIIQICKGRDDQHVFSNLLQNVEEEEEDMSITSTSTLDVCDDRVCCHIHIQMNESSLGPNYVAELKDKVSSWLS